MIIVLLVILFLVIVISAFFTYEEYKEVKKLEELHKTDEEVIVEYKRLLREIKEDCDRALKATMLVNCRHTIKYIKSLIDSAE